MNPWIWRAGLAAGLGGVTALAARQVARRVPHAPRPSDDLFGERPTVMGHRGAAAVAPENTLAAFSAAARLGIPFELDVTMAKTGEVVVFHDETLARTTDGSGRVDETAWARLRRLDAGSWFGEAFAGQRIPTLDAVLATFGADAVIDIEIKASSADVQPLAEAVVSLVEAHELVDRVMISSFDPLALEAVKKANAAIRRGQIVGESQHLPWRQRWAQQHLTPSERARPDLLMVQHTLLDEAYLRRMHAHGYRVFAWTVNSEAVARALVDLGVDGLITDHPERLLRALRPDA